MGTSGHIRKDIINKSKNIQLHYRQYAKHTLNNPHSVINFCAKCFSLEHSIEYHNLKYFILNQILVFFCVTVTVKSHYESDYLLKYMFCVWKSVAGGFGVKWPEKNERRLVWINIR